MPRPDRPLPESLTRLLGAPATRAAPPSAPPGDRAVGPRRPPGGALGRVVLLALVRGAAGLVWLGIVWGSLRWLMR